ncbi:preprotein translocase subunit SecG [Jiulongibacter sp. NS-SX5]|uniref:preprotein translocase subunit SecG n=1 Tax=Jiulongibacter sp. NS-SX5 TaxID=3463854 RepID=UPI004058F97F
MTTTIIILIIIVALLLIGVILIQNPKGGGLSSEFGGGATSQMFGVQKTGDILEQLTWGFFAFIVVGALATGIFMRAGDASGTNSVLDVETSQTAPAAPAPANPVPALPNATPAE